MPVKRKPSEDAYDAVLQDPLYGESQTARTSVSSDANVHPPTTASLSGAIAIGRLSRRRLNLLHDGQSGTTRLKETAKAPTSRSLRLALEECGIAYGVRALWRRSHREQCCALLLYGWGACHPSSAQ